MNEPRSNSNLVRSYDRRKKGKESYLFVHLTIIPKNFDFCTSV